MWWRKRRGWLTCRVFSGWTHPWLWIWMLQHRGAERTWGEKEFIHSFEGRPWGIGLWAARYYPFQPSNQLLARCVVVCISYMCINGMRAFHVRELVCWLWPKKFPSSSKNFCKAARATLTPMSAPVSQATQTRLLFDKWDSMKVMERGSTLCRKCIWPFLPPGVAIRKIGDMLKFKSLLLSCSPPTSKYTISASQVAMEGIGSAAGIVKLLGRSEMAQRRMCPETFIIGVGGVSWAYLFSRDTETRDATRSDSSERLVAKISSRCCQKSLGVNPYNIPN